MAACGVDAHGDRLVRLVGDHDALTDLGGPGPLRVRLGRRRGRCGPALALLGAGLGPRGGARPGALPAGLLALGLALGWVASLVGHGQLPSSRSRSRLRSRAIVSARARSRRAAPMRAVFSSSPVAFWKRRPKISWRVVRMCSRSTSSVMSWTSLALGTATGPRA